MSTIDWSRPGAADEFAGNLVGVDRGMRQLLASGPDWRFSVLPVLIGILVGMVEFILLVRGGMEPSTASARAGAVGLSWGLSLWLVLWLAWAAFVLVTLWLMGQMAALVTGLHRFDEFRDLAKNTSRDRKPSSAGMLFWAASGLPVLTVFSALQWLFFLAAGLPVAAFALMAQLSGFISLALWAGLSPTIYRGLSELSKAIAYAQEVTSLEDFRKRTAGFKTVKFERLQQGIRGMSTMGDRWSHVTEEPNFSYAKSSGDAGAAKL